MAAMPAAWMAIALLLINLIGATAVPVVMILAYITLKAITTVFNIPLVRTPLMIAIPSSTILFAFLHWIYIINGIASLTYRNFRSCKYSLSDHNYCSSSCILQDCYS